MTLVLNQLTEENPVEVRVVVSPVFEAVVAHWAAVMEAESLDSFLGHDEIKEIVEGSGLSEDDVVWMGDRHGSAWTFLVPLIDSSGAITASELAAHLEESDASALVGRFEQQANECRDKCGHDALSVDDPVAFIERLVSILRRVDERTGDAIAGFESQLRHEEQLVAFLRRRMDLERLVETVTNGIAYKVEAGIEEIILVPSVMVRPWNLMLRFGGSQYFVYPASEESVDANDDTPPSWMVHLFKAIGDEKRLRVLRRLAEEPRGLGDLAEYLGLAKSTTHHHLRALRAAGLVRHDVGGEGEESRYEIRSDVFPEAVRVLGQYLNPGENQ